MCVPDSSSPARGLSDTPDLAWRGWLFNDQPGETDSDTQGLGRFEGCVDGHFLL